MFTGAPRATRDRIGKGHVESHGFVRGQNFDAQMMFAESLTVTDGTFTTVQTGDLTVTNAFSAAQLIVNNGADALLIGLSDSDTVGPDSVLIGSGTSSASETIMVGTGNSADTYADNNILIGRNNTSTNDHNIVIGQATLDGREYNTLIGFGAAVSDGDRSTVIGRAASGRGDRTVVIGDAAHADDDDCVAIGTGANTDGFARAIAVGLNATSTAGSTVTVGPNSETNGVNSVSVGSVAVSNGANNVAVGSGALVGAVLGGVALGVGAQTNGASGVSIGYNSSTSGSGVTVGGGGSAGDGVCVGANSTSTSTGISIGASCNALQPESIAMGAGVSTRIAKEFATSCMRIVRGETRIVGGGTSHVPVFSLYSNGEIVSIDVTVTVHNNSVAPLGSQVVGMKLDGYIARRTLGAVAVNTGVDVTNDPLAKGYVATITSSGNDVRVSCTDGGAEDTSWVVIARIYGAPLT